MTPSSASPLRRLLPWFTIALVVIGLDQLTKSMILERYARRGEGTVITSFFNIVREHNPGAAFSMFADASGWQRWLFVGIAAVATVFIVTMLVKHSGQKLFSWALSLILGGAIGNVIDRLMHGYVVDFIQVHAGGKAFPSFNIADSAITLGAVFLIVDELLRLRKTR